MKTCPTPATVSDTSMCLLGSHVQEALLWDDGSGKLGTRATTSTMLDSTRSPSSNQSGLLSGRTSGLARVRQRPSSLASISGSQGPPRRHQHQYRLHRRPPRRQRPRHQPLRLQALGSAAMEDAEEETAKAG